MTFSNYIHFGAYKNLFLSCNSSTTTDLLENQEDLEKYYDFLRLRNITYRDQACEFACSVVCHIMKISRRDLCYPTRLNAQAALARQVAMYIAHVGFSQSQRAVGRFFKRDRTTVAHACRIVEDMRDDEEFDQMIVKMELIIEAARSSFEALMEIKDKEALL